MAETRTARFSLPNWGAGTDSGSRDDFNEAFANLEQWAARDEQGTRAARPAAGIRGRYWASTDTKVLYRDNGTSWDVVGAVLEGSTAIPAATGSIGFIAKGLASQTGDLFQTQDSAANVLSRFRSDGGLDVNADVISRFGPVAFSSVASVGISPASSGKNGLIIRGAASQSADLQRWQNSAGSDVARVLPDGSLIAQKVTVSSLTPVAAGDLTSKSYTDATYLPKTGGTVSGDLFIADATPAFGTTTVGGTLNIFMSRAAATDLVAMSIASTGAVQVGGGSGTQPGTVPLMVKGAAAQTANLFEVRNSANSALLYADNAGKLWGADSSFSGTVSSRLMRATAAAVGDIPGIFKAFAGQTADIVEIQDSAGLLKARFSANGSLLLSNTFIYSNVDDASNTMQMLVNPRLAAHRGLVIKAAAAQTADLFQAQDSTGVVLSKIQADGTINVPGTVALYGPTTDANNAAQALFVSRLPANVTVKVMGAAAQTADLQQWLLGGAIVAASVASNGLFRAPSGSAAAPSYSFTGNTDTGIASGVSGPGSFDFIVDGTTRASIVSSGQFDVMGNLRSRSRFVFDIPQGGVTGAQRQFLNVAAYNNQATSVTGAIVFKMPNSFDNTMQAWEFDGYAYNPLLGQYGFRVAGYVYSTGPNYLNSSVEYFSDFKPQVRLARETSSGKPVIIVGDVGTVWQYPKLSINRQLVGHSVAADNYADGWSSSLVTDLSGYDTIVTPPNRSLAGAGSNYDSTLLHTTGANTLTGSLIAAAPDAATIPMTIKGFAGQAADIFRVTDSTNAVLTSVDSQGRMFITRGLTINGSSASAGYTAFMQSSGDYPTLITRAYASQAVGTRVLDVQDSAGNHLLSVTPDGVTTLGSITQTGDIASALTNAFTAQPNWTINTQYLIRRGRVVQIYLNVTYTGGGFTSDSRGDIGNQYIAALNDSANFPVIPIGLGNSASGIMAAGGIWSDGHMTMSATVPGITFLNGAQFTFAGTYLVA